MSQRRSLVTGLEETPDLKEMERQFVYGDKLATKSSSKDSDKAASPGAEVKAAPNTDDVLPQYRGRVPLTTRCRPEVASALKKASLKRQLEGKEFSRIQEIVEEAIERWLTDNGYIG